MSKERQSEKELREFKVGDKVWMRNYSGVEKWIPGEVILKTGPLSCDSSPRPETSKTCRSTKEESNVDDSPD